MFKRTNNILLLLIITQFIATSVLSHVLHYKELNKLEFDLYRNDKLIGKHIYSFNRDGQKLIVTSKINFEIKKLGIVLYKYKAEGTEEYLDGEFLKFSSITHQNKKEKFCKIYKNENVFFIEGSSFKGEAPNDFIIGTWWNHQITKYDRQISAVSGRIIEQKVEFIGKEKINIGDKEYNALKFNFSSTDSSLSKDKKLNTNVWYDEKSLIWLKVSFDKTGKWEYRLKKIN